MANEAPLWFGGGQVEKRSVSYRPMPVDVNPALLEDYRSKGVRRASSRSRASLTSLA